MLLYFLLVVREAVFPADGFFGGGGEGSMIFSLKPVCNFPFVFIACTYYFLPLGVSNLCATVCQE